MMPLTMSPKMLSEAIRRKKKKMYESEPEMTGTSPVPDMDAQDIYDVEQAGRIEGTLMTPEKINSDVDNLGLDGNIGVNADEKARLGRLRKYFSGLNMWAHQDKMMGMME